MKRFRIVVTCLVAFIYLSFFFAADNPVQAVSVTISADHFIYPIWGIGGSVRVSAQNLTPNVTYYLWSQAPKQLVSNFTKLSILSTNGVAPAPIVLSLSAQDPPGTYVLSLSRSQTSDTDEAVAHFGVFGTDAAAYERSMVVTVAGGGFVPNSTILLSISSLKGRYPGFPVNVTAGGSGEFEYHFRLALSVEAGKVNATVTGVAYDQRQTETAKSTFTVNPSTITVQAFREPASQVQRTLPVSTSYYLSYLDGSPVTAANTTASVILANQTLLNVPLTLVNSTSGEWNATWTPPPSADNTTYHFEFNPANFTDPYGNKGQGARLTSTDFSVVPAKLQPIVQAPQTVQRTQNSTGTISATYPSGSVANVTQSSITVTTSIGSTMNLKPSLKGGEALESFKVPVNATVGNWTLTYRLQDPWGNQGSGTFLFHVESASITFQGQIPPSTQRTTSLNITNTAYYPDGDVLISRPMVEISSGNQSWVPSLSYDPASGQWSSSLYIAQNATTGPYNVTWAAKDPYGNAGNSTYTTEVIPARFSFLVRANNSTTVPPLSNVDLPVLVKYPNGTSLTNGFGNVTGSYSNSTGFVFTSPLAYNETNGTWHMYFSAPEQNNATISFNATDRFGNSAVAMDAFNLKIASVPRVVTRNLIIAGIIGTLIPIGLLVWAFATISARRRKHRP
jgi:hypothetical protein